MFHLMSFNHLAGCTIKLPAIRFNCAVDERLVQAPNRLGHHHLAVLWCPGKENPLFCYGIKVGGFHIAQRTVTLSGRCHVITLQCNGTLIVVSHDREFLDNVVTSTIVFEEDGRVQEYAGGYTDWARRGHHLAEADNPFEAEQRKRAHVERRRSQKPTKLGYKDQRELDRLPAEIESIENTVAELQETVAGPDFHTQGAEAVQDALRKLAEAEALLEQRFGRWHELESLQASLQSE